MRLLLALLLLGAPGAGLAAAGEITAANFEKAAIYSRTHGGLGLRVEQGGRLLFENYYPGFYANTPRKIYSGTKNFVAVAALLAEEDHLLVLDEKASDTLTEWRNDRRRTITIAQLLSQTSGLDPDGTPIDEARDQMQAAVYVHLIASPGEQFHYGAAGYQAFGEILKRKLRSRGQSVEDYIRARLIDPLGIDVAAWKHDDAGNPLMHAGMQLSAIEWAKFGAFVNRERRSKRRDLLVDPVLFSLLFRGHDANPAYGLSFWLNRAQPANRDQKMTDLEPAIDGEQLYPGGPRDLCAAIGSYRQRLYLIPSLDLVVVRFGYQSPFSDGDFLSRLLTGQPHPDAHSH
jgi:CubicO group peptidase (beta-lactamase class C family)